MTTTSTRIAGKPQVAPPKQVSTHTASTDLGLPALRPERKSNALKIVALLVGVGCFSTITASLLMIGI